MKIKKNGKVINLSESDVKRIVKRVLSEAPQGSNNITVYPEKAGFGYNHGNGMSPSRDFKVNPGDRLDISVFIPSDAPKGSIVDISNPSVSAGKVIKVQPSTLDGNSSGAKKYGVGGFNSMVRVIVGFDDLKKLKSLKGKDVMLKLGGANFTGGDKTVKIQIPNEMNVVTGSSKS